MKVLWITARLPAPLFSGDALYSAGLIRALAVSGAAVTVVGAHRFASQEGQAMESLENVTWECLPVSTRWGAISLLSRLPKDAYILASSELRAAVVAHLAEEWDWIVIDHANSGGVLADIQAARKKAKLCYIAHNVEGLIRPEIARDSQRGWRRLLMRLDAEKYRRHELAIVGESDAVISITSEDQAYFINRTAKVEVVPPVFLGMKTLARSIDAEVPASVLLVGSFEWGAKQRNLEKIVMELCPTLENAGITLNVVGAVPDALKQKLLLGRTHLNFHGRVPEIDELMLAARGGLVAEVFGGGFKLKVLDYAFKRLPIFGLDQALAGMAEDEKNYMYLAKDMFELGKLIVDSIDCFEELNRRQNGLFEKASCRFSVDWAAKQMRQVFV